MKPTYEELQIELIETRQLIQAIRTGQVDTIIGEDPEKKFFRLKSLKLEEERECLMSELKQTNKKLKEAISARDIFLKNMSHEMKSPLTEIIGFSELLLDEPEFTKHAQWKEFMQMIHAAGAQFYNLVENLFDLSRLLSGSETYNKHFSNMFIPVCSAVSTLKSQIQQKGINVIIDREEFEITAYIDQRQMERAVRNILENAVEYSDENSKIDISGISEGNQFKVIIKDSGRGIHPQEIETIFKQYTQRKQMRSGYAKRPGLGLAIARQIIEDHAGHIWAESGGLGEGAVFSFALPIKSVE